MIVVERRGISLDEGSDLGDQVRSHCVQRELRRPAPVGAGVAVVEDPRPGIEDRLASRVGREGDPNVGLDIAKMIAEVLFFKQTSNGRVQNFSNVKHKKHSPFPYWAIMIMARSLEMYWLKPSCARPPQSLYVSAVAASGKRPFFWQKPVAMMANHLQ